MVISAQGLSVTDRQRCEAEAKEVTIIRDKWGVPHIYGKTDAAVVFGLMYAECQEDFSRVEKNYLEMLGRQAAAYGENCQLLRIRAQRADAARRWVLSAC